VAIEIEHKFLVTNTLWKQTTPAQIFKQAYLNSSPERTVRIRVVGDEGFITIKSKNIGISREEFEYRIPVNDAEALLLLCETAPLEKMRYKIQYENHLWEVDEFLGNNSGLIIAEIELQHINEHFTRPDWLGEEVSDDQRYYNSSLSKNPFTEW
jgi:CYTH domain-containing protein